MNKKVLVSLGILMMLVMVLGVVNVQARTPRKITGGFFSVDFFGIDRGQFTFNIHEVDKATGEARGSAHWKEYREDLGLRRVRAYPVCVDFGEYQGQPAAVFVVKVYSIDGWQDPVEFEGELFKFWVLDGGTPGTKGDAWSTIGPWPPTDNLEDYGCAYEDPAFQFPVNGGNLVVHN
jgi:hypothetical protein